MPKIITLQTIIFLIIIPILVKILFELIAFFLYFIDKVVAPVRETCAQTLGVVLKRMDMEDCKSVMMALLTLQHQLEWEVRHGGLLGIKYLLAVRQVS